ncbi:MAG TPA: DUF4238 domain-containing protein, partial [Phycisphaerae bacterium]|nr:DUF4238 domain-containing protein [Phycisphaerae bacterium]
MKQHAVPKFYLRRFVPSTGEHLLWAYARDSGRARRVSPRSATAESHLYSVRGSDGSWDDTLERQLQVIESAAADPLKRLSSGRSLRAKDRECVSVLMGAMVLRVKAPRRTAEEQADSLRTPQGTLKFLETRSILPKILPPEVIAAYKARVLLTGRGAEVPRQFHLVNFVARAKRHGDLISKMTWNVYIASHDDFFVTSDNPAFARRPGHLLDPGLVGIGRADLGVELGFPLCRDSFLLASWRKGTDQTAKADGKKVWELNSRTVVSALTYVFSPCRSTKLESLVQRFA